MSDWDFELTIQHNIDVGRWLIFFEDSLVTRILFVLQEVLEFLNRASSPVQKKWQRVQKFSETVHSFLLKLTKYFLVIVAIHDCKGANLSAHYGGCSWLVFNQSKLSKTLPNFEISDLHKFRKSSFQHCTRNDMARMETRPDTLHALLFAMIEIRWGLESSLRLRTGCKFHPLG